MPNDLTPDLRRDIDTLQQHVVPEGPAPTGAGLRVTGQSPFRYGWSSEPPSPILEWHGNPDGELNARKGVLAVDIDTPALYQNQDGADSWEEKGRVTGVTSVYNDSPAGTTVPNAIGANLDWPGLSTGSALLDLSDTDTPTVTDAGTYLFILTVVNGSPSATLQLGLQAIDVDTSDQFTSGVKHDFDAVTVPLIGTLAAGSPVTCLATQSSGGPITVTLIAASVTRIA